MFFIINNILSVIVWLLVAYLLNFSVWGWIIGLIASFIFKEFIGPLLIIRAFDKYFQQPESYTPPRPISIEPPIKPEMFNEKKVTNYVCPHCQCEIKVSEYEMKSNKYHCSVCKVKIDFSDKK